MHIYCKFLDIAILQNERGTDWLDSAMTLVSVSPLRLLVDMSRKRNIELMPLTVPPRPERPSTYFAKAVPISPVPPEKAARWRTETLEWLRNRTKGFAEITEEEFFLTFDEILKQPAAKGGNP